MLWICDGALPLRTMLLDVTRIAALTAQGGRKSTTPLVASTYYNDSTISNGGGYCYFDHSGRGQR